MLLIGIEQNLMMKGHKIMMKDKNAKFQSSSLTSNASSLLIVAHILALYF